MTTPSGRCPNPQRSTSLFRDTLFCVRSEQGVFFSGEVRLYRWYANEPLKKQRSYGQKEQVRSEDCLFPVAGFLLAERQSTVKDALHRAAASSLTVGCLCSAEICLRDGDKTMLYNEAIGKFNKSRPFSRAVPLWERGGGVRGIPVKVFTSSPHNASSISNCGRNVATRGKLIASPTN